MEWNVPAQVSRCEIADALPPPSLSSKASRMISFARRFISMDGAPREREHEDARGIDAAHRQMRHAMRERIGLAGAGAGDDQQRTRAKTLPAGKWFTVGHRLALRSVQTSELFGRGHQYNNI